MTARICAGLAALLAAAPALASEETEGTVPMSPAWLEAYEMQGDVFTPAQRSLLSHLAWHAAVANICDGLSLDHARFGAALGGLEHTDAVAMSDDELRYYEHHVAVNFGVAVGLFLATHDFGDAETEEYCREIERVVAEGGEDMTSYFSNPAADAVEEGD
jgi:hypothetical protein